MSQVGEGSSGQAFDLGHHGDTHGLTVSHWGTLKDIDGIFSLCHSELISDPSDLNI